MPTYYIAQADCEALVTPAVVQQIYDDFGSGANNNDALNLDIGLACSMTDAKIARVYPGPFPVQQRFPQWVALNSYQVDASVIPLAAPNGYGFRSQILQGSNGAGVSGASEPVWQTPIGQTTSDGTVTWTCISLTPDMIRMLTLWAWKAIAWQRDPERVRQDGDKWFEMFNRVSKDVTQADSWLTDLLASPQPSNVGGLIVNQGARMVVDNADGTDNGGDF